MVLRVLLGIVALLVIGCGGSGGGVGGDLPPLVNEGVVVLSPTEVTVSDVTPDSLTLTGFNGSLEPGNVLVTEALGGILRRVRSVERGRGGIVVQTEPAGLTDVFQRARIAASGSFGASDFSEILPAEGVEVEPPEGGRAEGSWTLRFNDLPLSAGGGGSGGGGAAVGTLSGSIRFTLGVDFQTDIEGSEVRLIRIVPQYSITPTATARLTGGRGSVTLGEFKTAPQVYLVGGVPVTVTYIFKLEAKVTLEATGVFEVTASVTGRNGVGVEYRDGSLRPVSVTGIENPTLSFQLPDNPAFTLTLSPFSPDFEARLYESVGAFVTCEIPALPITYSRVTDPSDGARITLDGVLQGTGGLRLTVWDVASTDVAFPNQVLARENLFDRFFPDSGKIDLIVR